MTQCDICAEMGNSDNCQNCSLGNPCLGCEHDGKDCHGQCYSTGNEVDNYFLPKLLSSTKLAYRVDWEDQEGDVEESFNYLSYLPDGPNKGFYLEYRNADGARAFDGPFDMAKVKELISENFIENYEED